MALLPPSTPLVSFPDFRHSRINIPILLISFFFLCANGHPKQSQSSLIDHRHTISLLDGQLLLNPSVNQAHISGGDVCAKITDINATLIKSLGKSTGKPVVVHGQPHFTVSYCEQSLGKKGDETGEKCATGSNCATIYRWTKMLVRPGFVADHVLIPVDCLCVLNWTKLFHGQSPIIDESGADQQNGEN